MVRWRELLSHLGVAWVERGPNISRGEIGLQCPWCGSMDHSQHLALNELTGFYNCRRSPGHGGKSPYWLLRALAVRHDLDDLLEAYGGVPRRAERPNPPRAALSSYGKTWNRFKSAADDPEACDYLSRRGFWHPPRTCRLFDLRVGSGQYAGRLWFPYLHGDDVVGYTGRSMRHREPKYFTEAAGTYLYLPRLPYDTDKLLILVEGPIDALRLADATEEQYPIVVAALCGLSLTPDKRLQLAAFARLVPRLFVVLDSTVSPVAVNHLRQELMTCLCDIEGGETAAQRVQRLELPSGVDDPGELTGEQVEQWLQQTGVAQLAR